MTAISLPPVVTTLKPWAAIGRLHIVAIAALGTFTFGWLFTGEHPWRIATLCALDWFLVNILNRVVDLREDAANNITGTAQVAAHRRAILVLGLATLAASFLVGHRLHPDVTPLRVAYHALGLAYNWPLLPGRRRLKELYFWKNTASAAGFMLTVFGYPLAANATRAPGITTTTILVSALFFFLFEISYEVLYDLRDAPGDRLAGVRTYPVVHGESGALAIVHGLIAAASGVLVVGFALGAVPWRIFVMVLAPVLQLGYARRARRRGLTSADCVALTWLGALLLVAYHLWVAAGLPGMAW